MPNAFQVQTSALPCPRSASQATGKASAEEKKELIALFTALSKNEPPKGDPESWKAKTKALLDAAKADDGAALKKAADCAACHGEHKGKKK